VREKDVDKAGNAGSIIPLAAVQLGEEEIAGAVAVMRSGHLRAGARCAEFESRFAEWVGARFAVSVSNGTAALHIAALAAIHPGDEVLVPAFTFIASATSIALAGGRPVLVDIDPDTFNMDPADARRRLTQRTRAILPVHLFGNAADVSAIQALAREHNLRVIWDAAQAHGTRYDGRDVGSLDDLVCYSFYPTKNMTTGEGGMITTNSPELYERCQLLKSHCQARKYFHTDVGLNYRLTDIAAAIGLAQLQRVDGMIARRRANAAFLNRELASLPGLTLPKVQERSEHSYNQYTIQVDEAIVGISRDEFSRRLRATGVETGVHYPRALHHQPALAVFGPFTGLENSERAAQRVLSLPVHPGLSDADLTAIATAVRSAAESTGLRRDEGR